MKTQAHGHHAYCDIFAVGDRDTMGIINFRLSDRGLSSRTFTEPSAAVEAFRLAKPRPPVLITECLDCEGSGLRWIKSCKQIEPGVKVIVWSGHEKTTVDSLLAKVGVVADIQLLKGREGGDAVDVALAAHLLLKGTQEAATAAKSKKRTRTPR